MSTQLLALDTATPACTVALLAKGKTYRRHELAPRRHNQRVLPMIKALLIEAGVNLAELDAIVFGQGPGSFTGVRIAVSIAQGLAFGVGLPVVPVSTLQTLAQAAYRESAAQRVLVGWDARMGEVYWGAYQFDTERQLMLPVMDEGLYSPSAVPLPVAQGNDTWLAVGSAWQVYETALMQHCCASSLSVHMHHDCYPQAQDALTLGLDAFRRGDVEMPAEARPLYLRAAC